MSTSEQRVAIVGGCRTPFVKAGGGLAKFSFLDLGVHVVKGVVERLRIDPATIDELVFSTVLLDPRAPNAAREVVFRAGLSASLPAHFVSNNCISGLVAAAMIADAIRCGRISNGLAGGSESMSRPTLTFKPRGERFFLRLARARSIGERLKLLASFRPAMVIPQAPSPKEPSTGLTMGEHCELMAKEFGIARQRQDEIAFRSHQNAARAKSSGILAQEIAALDGVSDDNLIRADTSVEKLAKLPPVFDRSSQGTLTAGNSSALTDGASVVYLMAESRARTEGREIIAYLRGIEFAALAPSDGLLMAPGLAVPRLLQRSGLTIGQIDRFEIHEAFGAQVAANLDVWRNGWARFPQLAAIGEIPTEKINVNGGSIAIGHPFAATGGRLLLSLAHELKRKSLQRGLISVCAAGGAACAAIVERS